MELHSLKPAKGSVKKRKRIARGQGSGHGGTATRGHKGAKSRSGYKSKRGFEGGQMPLQRRVPKRGFKNINRLDYAVLNLDRIQEIIEKHNLSGEITLQKLTELRILSKNDKIKILGEGSLKQPLSIEAHAFSASAKASIEAIGGSIQQL